ncbi:replication-associated recombination protein A [Cryomorpha ignava]|uniref:Replication-associated recombination protein A n=1 Tax=Cryomorpha ignava TaxID=101383 RepID=A0A7K3WNF8_9FLAO|nr:replication-associated recombination protein A [Cryomorpha ignava]NEN23187.1 replication-associated recombination protein A [Cryomorpha ignava]
MDFTPLAERLRPKNLDEFIGQEQLVGKDAVFRQALQRGIIPSIIFWGPPGVGKTTLAKIIAGSLNRPFYTLSAVSSGVKDVREVIQKVEQSGLFGSGNAILFIDEIHRFSKSQQDSLLGAVEKGVLTLIGATTENPSFEVNAALLSRCQVFVLKALEVQHLEQLLTRALSQDKQLAAMNLEVAETKALFKLSGGDARRLLNVLETVIQSMPTGTKLITDELVANVIQENPALYDKDGEQHYDIISAFIKSIRGSDPNAGIYWLARMLAGGEDPKFIARRLIILASEDIGNANPTALVLANTTFDSVQKIGMPEARIILSQCVVYLAGSPKSNASYDAINKAMALAKDKGNLAVPMHLRNAPTKLMRDLGYGDNYKYSHGYEGNFKAQEYLPTEITGEKFYEPGGNARENEIRTRLKNWWKDKYRY